MDDAFGLSESDDLDAVATVENYDDEPDVCTIYPLGAPPEQRTTTWISAEEGSFVSLDDCR